MNSFQKFLSIFFNFRDRHRFLLLKWILLLYQKFKLKLLSRGVRVKCLVEIWKDSCIGSTIQPSFHSLQQRTNNSPSSWHEAMCTRCAIVSESKRSVWPWEGEARERWDWLNWLKCFNMGWDIKLLVTDKKDWETVVWPAYFSDLFFDVIIFIIILHIKAILDPHNTLQQMGEIKAFPVL